MIFRIYYAPKFKTKMTKKLCWDTKIWGMISKLLC